MKTSNRQISVLRMSTFAAVILLACLQSVLAQATQNKIPKWTDNAGTLGPSAIFEDASGNVGIGTNAPDKPFTLQGALPPYYLSGGYYYFGVLATFRTTGVNNGYGLLLDATGSGNNNVGFARNGIAKASQAWDNNRHFMGFANFEYP